MGVIELGAAWLPSFMRQPKQRLKRSGDNVSEFWVRPSDYVRQVRVTPFPTEPTRWIIETLAPKSVVHSDFPHVEGSQPSSTFYT